MRLVKPVGQKAPAIKYDVLTAIGAFAMSQPRTQQVLALRFLTLLTARYNWQRDELAVGQREIARLWSVDERTVKREMARLRGLGWLVVKRPGARGRVTQYGLDLACLLKQTQPAWAAVGPDFEQRMGQGAEAPAPDGQAASGAKIVALGAQKAAPLPVSDGSEWALAAGVLRAEDPAAYGNWLAPLTRQGVQGRRLVLRAPSRFHAHYVATHLHGLCLKAVRSVTDDIDDVVIEA
ncbi:hypothetical protein [Pseudoruegeria sp. SHC-113]|uniref:hypothetical protein n=1 Tax=Pseudoruegeria sp. SHC-113 TaxID=2855439 RepID=UPI0021BAD4C0|nr:hypothetical protein [Pseudoruegeria sp. SHC-113]MCT8162131.1 hypothetical protein [Pseudoruegeria sp. SHC-113]